MKLSVNLKNAILEYRLRWNDAEIGGQVVIP